MFQAPGSTVHMRVRSEVGGQGLPSWRPLTPICFSALLVFPDS